MSFQDPSGDTLTTEGANAPPLLGYGADSTLHTNLGSDAIPTSVTTPPGAPEPTASPQHLGATESDAEGPEGVTIEVTEVEVDTFDVEGRNLRRTGLIVGAVAAGLAAGAGIAWFFISRRRAQQARIAAAQAAQARRFLRMAPAPARQRLAAAADSGVALTSLARQSGREISAMANALAESAVVTAQDARDRALIATQLLRDLRDQTVSASQTAQGRFTDSWGRTVNTATTSWDAATQTAKVARDATLRTVGVARSAAKQTAKTARVESQRTAKAARTGFARAQKTATR